MASKQNPPFRVEHIGSLLRPAYLLEARKKFDKREITQEQLRALEDRTIVDAVNMQREVGIKSITDGEYRRHLFFNGFFEYLEGFEAVHNPSKDIFKLYIPVVQALFAMNTKLATAMLCTGKIRWVKSGYVPQFDVLKKLVHPDEVKNIKMTVVSPDWLHMRHGEHAFKPEVYADREDYFNGISIAYQQEMQALYAAGCRNVQIDGPTLTFFCNVSVLKGMRDEGTDPDALLDAYIRLYNNSLAMRPRDMTVGVHLCRGNNAGSVHFSEGGYDAVAVKLFNDLNVDCYYLEYDTERAGTLEPLKYLPKHKSVVLGIITSKFPELEDKADLRERVFEAARIMASGTGETVNEALERISVSPQCGFASHEDGNLLTMDDMKRKLQLVKELADGIWADA